MWNLKGATIVRRAILRRIVFYFRMACHSCSYLHLFKIHSHKPTHSDGNRAGTVHAYSLLKFDHRKFCEMRKTATPKKYSSSRSMWNQLHCRFFRLSVAEDGIGRMCVQWKETKRQKRPKFCVGRWTHTHPIKLSEAPAPKVKSAWRVCVRASILILVLNGHQHAIHRAARSVCLTTHRFGGRLCNALYE